MANINCVVITGNVSRDSEYRASQTGSGVLSFSVAVNEFSKAGDVVSFIDCVMFGARAQSLSQSGIKKGTRVAVRGRLHQSRWIDKTTGANRSKVDVYVDDLEFLSAKQAQDVPSGQGQTASTPATDAYADEDIPF